MELESEHFTARKEDDDLSEEMEFEEVLNQMDTNDISQVVASEEFVLEFLNAKLNLGSYDLVIKILKQLDYGFNPRFLKLWDDVHYRKYKQHSQSELTALQRYRIRKRNKPPVGICEGGERPSLRMSDESRALLEQWYTDNITDPYPSRQRKQELSKHAGITFNQVNTWFANARRKNRNYQRKLRAKDVVTSGFDVKTDTSSSGNVAELNTDTNPVPYLHRRSEISNFLLERPLLFGASECQQQQQGLRYDKVYNWSYNEPSTIPTPIHNGFQTASLYQPFPRDHVVQYDYQPQYTIVNDTLVTEGLPVKQQYQPVDTKYIGQDSAKEGTGRNLSDYVTTRDSSTRIGSNDTCYALSDHTPDTSKSPNRYGKHYKRLRRTRSGGFAIERLKMKLNMRRQQHAAATKCTNCVLVEESLNALSKLCSTIETTVISPLDYAKTVNFNISDEYITPTSGSLDPGHDVKSAIQGRMANTAHKDTDTEYLYDTSPNSRETHWTQIMDTNHGYRTPITDGVTRIFPMRSTSRYVSRHLYSPSLRRDWEMSDEVDPRILEASKSISRCSPTSNVDFNNNTTDRFHNKLHTTDFQVSYSTIVGEAIQGLLNLSSQDPDQGI